MIAPVAGLVVVILGIHLNEVVSHALNLIGATTAGLACFVTGLVLSAQPLRLNANVGACVVLKNIVFPVVAHAIALALGMSGQIAREAILLAALPVGYARLIHSEPPLRADVSICALPKARYCSRILAMYCYEILLLAEIAAFFSLPIS